MDESEILVAYSELELAHCFHEGGRLDIADCAAEFDDADVGFLARVVDCYTRNTFDMVLDCVCDVRDNLHCLSQVIAFPLP